MFNNFVSSEVGLIHLIVSVFALVFGTWVLAGRKGTRTHRRAGYAYAASMILLLATAFMIYRLFGRFGVFHFAAIVSTTALFGGMIPVIVRKPTNGWLNLHFKFYVLVGVRTLRGFRGGNGSQASDQNGILVTNHVFYRRRCRHVCNDADRANHFLQK